MSIYCFTLIFDIDTVEDTVEDAVSNISYIIDM